MEPQEFKFRGGRIFFEVILAGLAVGLGAVALRRYLPPPAFPPVMLGALCLALLSLTFSRWLLRVWIDRDGIALRRSGEGVVSRLEWEEIDELFFLGSAGFEVRGEGKAVRISGYYSNPERAQALCSARLGDLRDRLRARALRDGELAFRMPSGRLKAHVSYLLAILTLTIVTGFLVAPILLRGRFTFPVVIVLFAGSWLWGLRRRASRLGTVVTLYRDGLLVRRLDGRDKISWSELASSEWDAKGGLDLVLRSGRRISLPPSLGNISLLEEFVEEGRQAAAPQP